LRNPQKNKMFSHSYDVNDHVYQRRKFIKFRTNLANIEVIRILTKC